MVSVGRSDAALREEAEPPPWLAAIPIGIAVALLPALLVVGGIVGVAFVGALLARPRLALYSLAFTVPYQGLAEVRIQGANVTATEAVIGLLLVGWGTARAANRVPAPRLSPLTAAIGFLLSLLVLSCAVAPNLTLSAKELVKWSEVATVIVIGQSLLSRQRDRATLFWALTAAAVSQSVYGLMQSTLLWGPSHFMIWPWLLRAYGSFEQPNPFGGYLGLHLPLVVSVAAFGSTGRWSRGPAMACAAIIATCLVATMSRGAWLGQVTGLLVVALVGSRAARHAVATFGGLGVVLLLAAWPILPATVTDRVQSIFASLVAFGAAASALTPENWAVMERLSQWTAGWRMFAANPLVGVGIGNYNSVYNDYRLPEWPVALGHAHNHYLTIAAEAGIFAAIAYIILLVVAVRQTLLGWRTAPSPFSRAIGLGALGSIGALATHNMVDVLFVHGMSVTIGLILALAGRVSDATGGSDR
jgi:putative inorganic carbon (HCO3(-)) transporter